MVACTCVGACTCELVVVAVDDFLGELAGRFDCIARGVEEKESFGAFWTVFGSGVCDCASVGELFAVAVAGEFLAKLAAEGSL